MKTLLLPLSGDPHKALLTLRESHPEAREIETLARDELERLWVGARLRSVRRKAPDLFVIATERLTWQQGRDLLLLFGALAGARKSIIVDAHGGICEEARAETLLRAPARLAREAVLSATAIIGARRQLQRLEREAARCCLFETAEASVELPRSIDRKGACPGETDGAMSAPRVLYLRTMPGAATQVGGAATHTVGVINALIGCGARLFVLSNDPIPGLDPTRLALEVIEPEPYGLTRALFDLRNALLFTRRAPDRLKGATFDLIYQRYSRFNWTGVEVSLRTGRPLFLEYNGSEVWIGRHWDRTGLRDLLARCERLNLAAAARIFVVSEVEKRNLVRAGLPEEKIIVNPNGVDVQTFRPGVGGDRARAELGIDPDEILVGFTGTFGPWHGVTTLAEAIASVPREARIRFLLIGTGRLRGEVERRVREAGASDRVMFVGPVPHEHVPRLLDACEILVSPHVPLADGSEFFGSPTKLFEYMAMGKAIIASRLGQIAEALTDGETALLVPPGDVRALREAILELARAPELRARLGAAARRAAIERHTWEENARRILRAYFDLMRSSAESGGEERSCVMNALGDWSEPNGAAT
ncbi:MAG: glycosyltransferase family 4 protein [Pyrinomonas methylaliphatogenes]|jgi:glycosyltransferase involved in cell wall biosynthesis|nr:glycosyltransferase family 4 protein [Pyrinomonas methylaliphatogenes]